MAVKLGMTPLAFRKKCFVQEDPKGGFAINVDNKRPTSSYAMMKCLDIAAEQIGYSAKYHAPGTKTLADGRMHGIAISGHRDPHGSMSAGRGMIAILNSDGSVKFITGQSRLQGGPAAYASIIAEVLGLKYTDIGQSWGDPDHAPDGGSQAGSAGTINNGMAAMRAAESIRSQMFTYAVTQAPFAALKSTVDDLDLGNGNIFLKSDPTKTTTWKAVAAKIPKPCVGVGKSEASTWRKPDGKFPLGTAVDNREDCATAYEVAVDPETGDVEILSWVNVGDAGRCIDLKVCDSQIVNSDFAQIGKAIYWELMHDGTTGTLLTQNYLDDKMPTSMDYDFEKNNNIELETINVCGPFGAHGVAEPLAVPGYSSLVLAINNAINPDVWLSERPLRPWRILKGLKKA
jgi:CO/xanthine dehydrogenase Mo-binding subunit